MKKKLLILSFLFITTLLFAQPPGFVDDVIGEEFDIPTGLTFDKNGQLYVWEKRGVIWKVNKANGQKELLIDLQDEVYNFLDQGLKGVVLDPDFLDNGLIYLMYPVDRNYIENFGKDTYDPALNDQFTTTIGRITRYKITNGQIDQTSRKILLGDAFGNGIPIIMDNHGTGSLVFGNDGSLLVSVGDVALARESFKEGDPFYFELVSIPIRDGIITAAEDVGPFRSQLKISLNGKILRINPETGDA